MHFGFCIVLELYLCLFVCFFCLFRATPATYGGSQAMGRIRDVTASLCHSHSNVVSEPYLEPTPQQRATLDPNPMSKTRDQSCFLMDASQICVYWPMMGIPVLVFCFLIISHSVPSLKFCSLTFWVSTSLSYSTFFHLGILWTNDILNKILK